MPNWCSNKVTVSGSLDNLVSWDKAVSDIKKIKAVYRQRGRKYALYPLSFEKLLPTPPKMLEGDGWYNWRVANWGTKWDLDEETQQEVEDNNLVYHFSSAWSPPLSFFQYASSQFSDLTFDVYYEEPGVGFAGRATYKNNEILAEDEWEFKYKEEEDWIMVFTVFLLSICLFSVLRSYI